MKKILFIDDGRSESTHQYRYIDLEKKISHIIRHSNKIQVDFTPKKAPITKIANYDIIFIHNSQDEPYLYTPNEISLLIQKDIVLYTFSGLSPTDLSRKIFNRELLYNNFPLFIRSFIVTDQLSFRLIQDGYDYLMTIKNDIRSKLLKKIMWKHFLKNEKKFYYLLEMTKAYDQSRINALLDESSRHQIISLLSDL